MKRLALAFLALLLAVPALAAPSRINGSYLVGVPCTLADGSKFLCPTATTTDASGNPVNPPGTSSAITGSTSAATITSSSVQYVAAASRTLLAIDNESTTATIACRFGGTAAINTAGSFTIPPGVTRVWNSYPVPADAVTCISSAATSPATIEAY